MAKQDVAGRVEEMLQPYLEEKGLCVYKIEYKKVGREWQLGVFLDKPEGAEEEFVNIDECEDVNRYLSDELDKTNLIDRQYTLYVSSAGLDRELIKDDDFRRFAGRDVEVKLYEPIDKSKYYLGELVGLSDGIVTLRVTDKHGSKELEIPRNKISKINLAVIF